MVMSEHKTSLKTKVLRTALAGSLAVGGFVAGEAIAKHFDPVKDGVGVDFHPESLPEAIKEKHRQATVQLKAELSDDTTGDTWTQESCSATNLGKGWFLTANHCFEELFVGGGYYNQIYDAQTTFGRKYSLWQGRDAQSMKRLSQTDSIVLNGNHGKGDVTLVHIPGTDNLPSFGLADKAPTKGESYLLTGYPGSANGRQVQHELHFLGALKGGEYGGDVGNRNVGREFYIFGVPKDSPEAANACHPGMSGGSAVDSQGKIYAIASEYDPSHSVGADILGFNPEDYAVTCAFLPVSSQLVSQLEADMGKLPDRAELTGK